MAPAGAPPEIECGSELPLELLHLPEPPVLQPAPVVQFLDAAEVLRRLRGLELGQDLPAPNGQQDPAHDRIVAAALAAIGDPASQKKYFPRRPSLLPELIRAMNDETVSVRQVVPIVARDPSLVGNLLRVANSSYYRVTPQAIETIERALVILGSDGLRSVMAAALMQPIFQVPGAGGASRFPEIVWEHAVRSAHAAIPHASLVERANPFAAELLTLIWGLAEIVLFRAVLEHCTPSPARAGIDPLVVAAILDSQSTAFAWHIGAEWRLSEEMLAALEEQMLASEPATPLGRSLRFGRRAGALAVLHGNSLIDETSLRVSLPPSGLSPAHRESMLKRLLRPHEDPRTLASSQTSSTGRRPGEQSGRPKRGTRVSAA
ncbi:MAG TPA: HDOD domain-containing protein [Steroidobacteraceae bacterium]|jgi:HD-like signal output (HDOD) protein|nr:HDOD domain-containing protein [Steroidobacteraceae bacterium]